MWLFFNIIKHSILFILFCLIGVFIVLIPLLTLKGAIESAFTTKFLKFVLFTMGATFIPYLLSILIIKWFNLGSLWAYAMGAVMTPLVFYIFLIPNRNPYKLEFLSIIEIFNNTLLSFVVIPYLLAMLGHKVFKFPLWGSCLFTVLIEPFVLVLLLGTQIPYKYVLFLAITAALCGSLYGVADQNILCFRKSSKTKRYS